MGKKPKKHIKTRAGKIVTIVLKRYRIEMTGKISILVD